MLSYAAPTCMRTNPMVKVGTGITLGKDEGNDWPVLHSVNHQLQEH